MVATHDVEFASVFAERVVLLGDGELIADGPVAEILSGGWYFATEVARILGADRRTHLRPETAGCRSSCRRAARSRSERRRSGSMSWQLTAYALLALVLAGGLAWYERSRPPARMVALVAALAALAVAGRLVFAPIPNVVATTDIVLITGYAVGPAPGFAVGALAAAVSNLWLGQGPWTPWQMAGWGLVGLGGAALAVLTRRRLGRVGLAAACGLAGLAYGALLDLSVMVAYGGEQSLDRYLAISARGIPFNVAHAVGNVALALAAGPALVRMISRYRSRFEFTWRRCAGAARRRSPARARPRRRLALLLAALAVGGDRWPCRARPGRGRRLGQALARAGAEPGWRLRRLPGRRLERGDHGLGRAGAGERRAATRSTFDGAGASPIGYLRSQVAGLRSTGDLERTILALEGAGVNPRRFGGRDLVAELRKRRSRERLVRGPGEPDRVRNPRPARRRRSRVRCGPLGRLAARGPERRRRLGLSAAGRQRPGQHRRRAPGPGGGRGLGPARPHAGRPTCGAPSAPTAASRWPRADPPTRSRPPGRSKA